MNRGDRALLILPLALTAVGVVMVYSSSAILGITRFQNPDYFFFRQLLRALIGVAAMVACTRVRLKTLEALAPWLLAGAAGLLAAVVVAGHVSNGAARWLKLGLFTMQPTDLARLAVVVFIAWWLKRNPPGELGFWKGVGPALLVVGGLAGLILLQPNLSSAALLGLGGLTVIFLAGARPLHLLLPVGGGLLIGVDLQKDPDVIEAAYNDSSAVTAQFNLNLLARTNRELGADFDLQRWRHRAIYNAEAGRIEEAKDPDAIDEEPRHGESKRRPRCAAVAFRSPQPGQERR